MSFFSGKTNFLIKNSSFYVECNFGKSDKNFMPKIQKTLFRFSKLNTQTIFLRQKKYTSPKKNFQDLSSPH